MEHIFIQLVAIILFSTVLGLLAKLLKQPLVLAYIVAGIVLGPSLLNFINPEGSIIVFSQIGVAFLLFLVGLSMSTRVFREVGKVSLITGLAQVTFTTIFGFFISRFLGFSIIESLYIAIALTFSSTIIIVKLLSDKNDLDTLYGKISIGFLIIQDFIAIAFIVIITGLSSGLTLGNFVVETVLKLAVLLAVPFLFNRYFLNYAFEKISKNHELLFLSGISWCFVMAAFSYFLGFSIEIGAFLAGISLASIPHNYEIVNKIKPLRDFFLILFFVILGSQIIISGVTDILFPALIFSLFVLIGNPMIVLVLMGLLGYRKRTSFLSGLTVAQISEFSLILLALGVSIGAIQQKIVSLGILVGIITIATSSYLILHGEKIFSRLSRPLSIFERKKLKEKIDYFYHQKRYEIVLVGYHEMGHHIMKNLKAQKEKTLVIDFNPSIISYLSSKKVPCLYGDISDPDTIEKVKSFSPHLVISTTPTFEENINLIRELKSRKRTIFVTTKEAADAADLYKAGADYVMVPHMLGGEKASILLEDFFRRDFADIAKLRSSHQKDIKDFIRWMKTSNKRKPLH